MCTIYVSFISSILYFEFHRIMQHEYFVIGGCTIKVLYFQIVPRVVYSHIFGSIRSSNLADPHSLIRGCESATLLDRIDIEYGLDPFWFEGRFFR